MTDETEVEEMRPTVIYLDHPIKQMRMYWGGKDWVRDLESAKRFGCVKDAMTFTHTMAKYSGVIAHDDALRYKLAVHQKAGVKELDE
ncbi:MAG: hypothetical protein AB7U75_14950 [Hyphomicrobiaceae bacterium]